MKPQDEIIKLKQRVEALEAFVRSVQDSFNASSFDWRAKLQTAGRERWRGVKKASRVKVTSTAGKASWAKMNARERSAEMKRRGQVREQNRKARALENSARAESGPASEAPANEPETSQ